MQQNIKNLESQFEMFTQRLGSLKGEHKLLSEQQENSETLIEKYKEDEETHCKAVELLSLVQKVTRDKVKDGFEKIISHALNFIYESDKYAFHLEFGRRGNLQELDFNVLTPEKPEPLDLLKTDAGGTKNIVSLVLRLVLMEICQPKINGFIISDESFANLSPSNQPQASEFIKEINKRFGRQIIMITHSKEFIENSDYHKIEIK